MLRSLGAAFLRGAAATLLLFVALSLGLLAVMIVRYHLIHPYALAATIAHEIATPLATIGIHADEIASIWAHESKGSVAVAQGLDDDHGHARQSERIGQLAIAIRREVSGTSAMVEMALASFTLDRLERASFNTYSVQQCVTSALERYPFRGDERSRVSVMPIDPALSFSGSDTVVIFILFNLLKNALHATEQTRSLNGNIKKEDWFNQINSFFKMNDRA